MISRTWLFVGLGAALGVGYYLIKVKPARDAEGVRESAASRDMVIRAASKGAARRVNDVIKEGPKPGVIMGPAGYASQLTARLNRA